MKVEFLFLTFVATLIPNSLAILCYDCVTANVEKCNRGKELEFSQCSEPINYDKHQNNSRPVCLKGIEKVDGGEKIYRGCAIKDGPEDTCNKLSKISPLITCETCEEDYCNTANNVEMWIFRVATFLSTFCAIRYNYSF